MKKTIKYLVVVLLLLCFELVIKWIFGGVLELADFSLVLLLFIGITYHFYQAVLLLSLFALILELYSSMPLGFVLLPYLMVFFILFFVSQKLLTNKSLYAFLGMIFLGTIFLGVFQSVVVSFWQFFLFRDWEIIERVWYFWWQQLSDKLVVNLLLTILLFVFFNFFSLKFKGVYLEKNNLKI